jgi:hypothetical protein
MQTLRKEDASDDEDDEEYVPPPETDADDGGSSRAKRARTTEPAVADAPPALTNEERQKCVRIPLAARTSLTRAFQSERRALGGLPSVRVCTHALIVVRPTHGEDREEAPLRRRGDRVRPAARTLSLANVVDGCSEVVEVPADSEDARKWPRWTAPGPSSSSTSPPEAPTADPPPDIAPGPESASTSKPAPKRPGPRKSKIALGAPTTAAPKAKKLSTLDKSALDWQAHANADADDLAVHRRGGGYLARVDFLQRVDARRSDALEASTGTKRRRG